MLSKKERLSRIEFNRFFSVGKRIQTPSLQIIYTVHTNLHVSVVVPKKIVKLAVGRNKIRRQIYDIVRRYKSEEGITGVFILIIKDGAQKKTYGHLKSEIYEHLGKIHNKVIKK